VSDFVASIWMMMASSSSSSSEGGQRGIGRSLGLGNRNGRENNGGGNENNNNGDGNGDENGNNARAELGLGENPNAGGLLGDPVAVAEGAEREDGAVGDVSPDDIEDITPQRRMPRWLAFIVFFFFFF
jgi:hypothetical protein